MDNGGTADGTSEHAKVSVRQVLLQLAQTTTDASSKQALLELASGLNDVEPGATLPTAANLKPSSAAEPKALGGDVGGDEVLDAPPTPFAATATSAVTTGDSGEEHALDEEMERWLALVINRDFGATEDFREGFEDEAGEISGAGVVHCDSQSGESSPCASRTSTDRFGASSSGGDDSAHLMRALNNDDADARAARFSFGPGSLMRRRLSRV